MKLMTQHGYLVLADISGYTSYVARTELEGDAVFAHAPREHVMRGETLLELLEATYVAL